jgi:hypothetical protein
LNRVIFGQPFCPMLFNDSGIQLETIRQNPRE